MSTVGPTQTLAAAPPALCRTARAGVSLQRKCACGSATASLADESVQRRGKTRLQAKLVIGKSDDPLEKEADRIADQILAAPVSAEAIASPVRVQRSVGQPNAAPGTVAPVSVERVLESSGRPLEPMLKHDMEHRFGQNFSRVRIYSDAEAAQSARDVNAHAYAVGSNIVFAAGQFAPQTQEGRRLIAHELAHVVQQTGGDGSGANRRARNRGGDPARHQGPTALQRSEITTGNAATVKFTIGTDVSLALAWLAWSRSENGVLDDLDIAVLRDAALWGGETIDDNERMFIAALLDSANAKKWRAEGGSTWGLKIEFPAASISAANRTRVRDFGRSTKPVRVPLKESDDEGEHAAALDAAIVDLAGPFAGTARDVLAIADQAKVGHEAIYFAMLNGASDSTPGDRAFAGGVYAVARQERLSAAADLMAGRFKVDQVPRSSLPGEGMYQPAANASGWKGDTLYLPSDLRFLSLGGQGTVIHELTHEAQDEEATTPGLVPVVDAEMPAFRAEARYFLEAIAKRSGPARDRAVEEIAKEIRLPTLLCAVLEATDVLGNETALAALKELHAKVQSVGDPGTALDFRTNDFTALLAGLEGSDEDRRWETLKGLEKRIRKAIQGTYQHIAPAFDDGLRGESALDKTKVQRKLVIGASSDPLEREADRVADQVLAKQTQPDFGNHDAAPRIHPLIGPSAGQSPAAPESVSRTLASPASPLPPALQQDMEQRFAHDFSRVRVHSDAIAEQSALEVDAHAYTVGHDIVFGPGQFSPATATGRRLIAHELTHVVQQSADGQGAGRHSAGHHASTGLLQREEAASPSSPPAAQGQQALGDAIQPEVEELLKKFAAATSDDAKNAVAMQAVKAIIRAYSMSTKGLRSMRYKPDIEPGTYAQAPQAEDNERETIIEFGPKSFSKGFAHLVHVVAHELEHTRQHVIGGAYGPGKLPVKEFLAYTSSILQVQSVAGVAGRGLLGAQMRGDDQRAPSLPPLAPEQLEEVAAKALENFAAMPEAEQKNTRYRQELAWAGNRLLERLKSEAPPMLRPPPKFTPEWTRWYEGKAPTLDILTPEYQEWQDALKSPWNRVKAVWKQFDLAFRVR